MYNTACTFLETNTTPIAWTITNRYCICKYTRKNYLLGRTCWYFIFARFQKLVLCNLNTLFKFFKHNFTVCNYHLKTCHHITFQKYGSSWCVQFTLDKWNLRETEIKSSTYRMVSLIRCLWRTELIRAKMKRNKKGTKEKTFQVFMIKVMILLSMLNKIVFEKNSTYANKYCSLDQ